MESFSVLMSVYVKEKPEYLVSSLDSIFNQTCLSDEVVLVIDGPLTENLYMIVQEYSMNHSELKVVSLSVNEGLGRALNEGLKHCTHELVVRMDSDDICFPDRFEKQVKFMKEHPDVDISSTWIEEFENNIENVTSIRKVPSTHEKIAKFIKKRNPLNHPAVIFRKSSVLKSGGYMHFPLFEDWYLWARMMTNGCRFANIPECLLHFRTSLNMMKRRGGFKYVKDNFKFQNELCRLGLISRLYALKSGIVRGIVYLMPNNLRRLVYFKLLRS